MSQTRSVRKDNVKFDVHYPLTTPEIFVDGIDQNLQGFPHSKIIFYQTTRLGGGEDEVTQRVAALRLTIPTAALLSFCKETLKAYASGNFDYENAAKRLTNRISKTLDNISLDEDQDIEKTMEKPPKRRSSSASKSKTA